MQENIFLGDYFSCVGFLPFTSQRCGNRIPLSMRACQRAVSVECSSSDNLALLGGLIAATVANIGTGLSCPIVVHHRVFFM